MKILEGITCVEVSLYGFVPAAAAALADLGADVIKIEHPEYGDPVRGIAAWGIPAGTGGIYYLWESFNRGKQSIGVDLATPGGHDVLMRLIDRADVFLTSFLPDARRRLGIDVEDIRARNPKVIYARGSANGPRGPEAENGGFDAISYWQRTGIGSALKFADDEPPAGLPGPGFGDVQSGMNLAGGVLGALYHRAQHGEALVVDTSLLASGLWAMQASIAGASVTGWRRLRREKADQPRNPLANMYRTADNRFLVLAMLQADRYWAQFCATVGANDLLADERFRNVASRTENSRDCTRRLAEIFAEKPLADWVDILGKQEGQWSVVREAGDVIDDVQAVSNDYVQQIDYGGERPLRVVPAPVQYSATGAFSKRAPAPMSNTDEVLLDLGLTYDAIMELKIAGAIA